MQGRRIAALAAALTVAAPATASASGYYISRAEAVSDARQTAYEESPWDATIGGEYYEHDFARTRGFCFPKRGTHPKPGTRLYHRWRCEVYDPTGDCLDTFGPGVFGHPGVSLLIAGSLVPSRFTWRTLEGLRCHGD
jgi:hypothetical protein